MCWLFPGQSVDLRGHVPCLPHPGATCLRREKKISLLFLLFLLPCSQRLCRLGTPVLPAPRSPS